jgi:hypothetical protein
VALTVPANSVNRPAAPLCTAPRLVAMNIRWIGLDIGCDMANVRRYLDSGHRLIYKDI